MSPPRLIPSEDLGLFYEITSSTIFNQVLEDFLSDTLDSGSQTFLDLNAGNQMFKSIIGLVMAGQSAFYAPLMNSHGKSSCNFMFIKEQYRYPKDLDQWMKLLPIIHECAHMYKINNNGKICQKFSLQTAIKYENTTEI